MSDPNPNGTEWTGRHCVTHHACDCLADRSKRMARLLEEVLPDLHCNCYPRCNEFTNQPCELVRTRSRIEALLNEVNQQ